MSFYGLKGKTVFDLHEVVEGSKCGFIFCSEKELEFWRESDLWSLDATEVIVPYIAVSSEEYDE
jgi:hypothetical protein